MTVDFLRFRRASCVFHLASEINPQAPLDDESRFLMFDTSGLYDVRHPRELTHAFPR